MPARILLIEDNPANLELMTYLLGAFGYATQTAHDGGEGLERVRCEMPDLIVCDIQLPTVDGYEVARCLKADPALSAIPLVAVTALAMVGDRDKVLAAKFDGYIAKPIDPERFVMQVESFLPAEQRSHQRAVPQAAALAATVNRLAPASRKATILVVDDLPTNIDFVRSTLEPFGYRVVGTASARDALRVARQIVPDLILSDVYMPETDGLGLVRAVKADPALRAIAFVFLASTPTTPRQQQEACALGGATFILRPLEPQVLLRAVEDCLRAGAED